MTGPEASLIARMQAALVSEGVLHNVRTEEQLTADRGLITEAVTQVWDGLEEWERRVLRYWRRA